MSRLSTSTEQVRAAVVRALSISVAIAAGTIAARAQTAPAMIPNPQFAVAGGISIPAGGFAHNRVPGFNLAGTAEFRGANQPLGVRGELLYQYFGHRTDAVGATSANTVAAVLSILYHVPGSPARPYLIGGMGMYHIPDQGNNAGLSVGTGVTIPLTGVGAYAEVRVHTAITQGASFVTIPLTFGITF